ncbi:MAG TPA: glycosyltransferase, partial [Chryseolinea sp.]|nr:glycosyltransferase [Chryseolinea sp.]
MKLLHVINSMDPSYGGTCQAVRNLVPGLQNLGVDSEVVSIDDPNAAFLGRDSFRISAVGPSRGAWSYSSKFTPWLEENVSRFNSVIIHGLWQYPGYATSKVIGNSKNVANGKGHKPKLFVMPHGMLDPYFQKASGRRLKALRNILYWKLIEGNVINSADALLFTCEEERHLAKQPFRPYHPAKECVVGLGVEDPPPFTQVMRNAFLEKCKTAADRRYILFLSRIHEKKGVDLLVKSYIEVFKNSEKIGPDLPV